MYELVEQWKVSGKTQAEFARECQIGFSTFKYWLQKFRGKDQDQGSFIRLDQVASADIRVRYPNGVELLVPAHTPTTTLVGLVKLLE
jgi:transposase-like protein